MEGLKMAVSGSCVFMNFHLVLCISSISACWDHVTAAWYCYTDWCYVAWPNFGKAYGTCLFLVLPLGSPGEKSSIFTQHWITIIFLHFVCAFTLSQVSCELL